MRWNSKFPLICETNEPHDCFEDQEQWTKELCGEDLPDHWYCPHARSIFLPLFPFPCRTSSRRERKRATQVWTTKWHLTTNKNKIEDNREDITIHSRIPSNLSVSADSRMTRRILENRVTHTLSLTFSFFFGSCRSNRTVFNHPHSIPSHLTTRRQTQTSSPIIGK